MCQTRLVQNDSNFKIYVFSNLNTLHLKHIDISLVVQRRRWDKFTHNINKHFTVTQINFSTKQTRTTVKLLIDTFISNSLICLPVYLSVQCQSTLLMLCFVLEPRSWRIHLCVVIPVIVYNICLVQVNSVV